MTLPNVEGWVIDFRTAREIFASGSNERISHCIDACGAGRFHVCHCEEKEFKSLPALRAPFIDEHDCLLVPDTDDMSKCLSVSAAPLAKRRAVGDEASVFITGIAASKGYGVISNHRSFVFATVYDLCCAYGIPVLSADDYFAEAI